MQTENKISILYNNCLFLATLYGKSRSIKLKNPGKCSLKNSSVLLADSTFINIFL